MRYDLADVPAECVKVDGRYLVRHPGAVAQLRYGVVVGERGTAIIIAHAAALNQPWNSVPLRCGKGNAASRPGFPDNGLVAP